MWRYPVLLLVASPLLYSAYRQGEVLFDLWSSPSGLSDKNLDECKEKIEDARKSTADRGRPSDALLECLLKADDRCPEANADGSTFDEKVTPPAQAHAKSLKDVRTFFGAYAELGRGGEVPADFGPSHPYRLFLEKQRDARVKANTARQDIIAKQKTLLDDLELAVTAKADPQSGGVSKRVRELQSTTRGVQQTIRRSGR